MIKHVKPILTRKTVRFYELNRDFNNLAQDKRKFLNEVKNFYWDYPYLFNYYPDQIFRRCIPDNEVSSVIKFCHSEACGVIFHQRRQPQKSYNVDFIGPPCSRTHMHSARLVKTVKSWDLFQNVT